MRISAEPEPKQVFTEGVPDDIQELYQAARIARDRYFAALAHEVFMRSPQVINYSRRINPEEEFEVA